MQTEPTFLEHAATGAVAGVASRCFISPFDVVKIRIQLSPHRVSLLQTIGNIARNEGFKAFWKGNFSATILYFSYGAVQFSIVSVFQPYIPTFISGGLAGLAATTLTYPFDTLRTRFAAQTNIYPNFLSAISQIQRAEGMKGFFRGLGPTLLQIVPLMGIVFSTHEYVLARLDKNVYGQWRDTISGGVAGIFGKSILMPLDVVRKRLQVQGPIRNSLAVQNVPHYTGMVSTFMQIIKYEGIRGLYKGLVPALLKAGPSTAITFGVVGIVRRFLKDSHA